MNSGQRTQVLAIGALAGLSIAWGAIPLFVRNDVPSIQLVGARVTFGALALVGVAASLGRLTIPKVRRWRLVLSGVLLALHWITFFESIKLTTVAVALAVLYLGPIAAAILAGPMFGEHVDRRLWAALAVAAIGTLIVVQPWRSSSVDPLGVAMAGLSAAAAATDVGANADSRDCSEATLPASIMAYSRDCSKATLPASIMASCLRVYISKNNYSEGAVKRSADSDGWRLCRWCAPTFLAPMVMAGDRVVCVDGIDVAAIVQELSTE